MGKDFIFVKKTSIMATIKFLIKGKTDLVSIYVRLRDGVKTDVVTSTGFTINPKYWSEAKGEPLQTTKNTDKLNLGIELSRLRQCLIESLNNDKGTGIEIDKEWLNLVIARFKNPLIDQKTQYLIDFIQEYQDEMKTRINPTTERPISQGTIKNLNTTMMRLKKFEKYKKKKYLINEIDLTFHSDLVKYERNILTLAQNSISKDIKQIKTVCLDAFDKGFAINEQVRSRKFNAPTEKTLFVTITENEIEEIKKFKGADYLQNARDWLIIGCWTGCRVNDLMKLTSDNIQMNQLGQRFIRYTQSKTNKQVDIPIHSDVEEIVKRLGGFPRSISDQRFNDWIKDVCRKSGMIQDVYGTKQNKETHKKEVGIFQKWELIKSHSCRRSFATNHYNKLSNKLIMAVTGHTTEKMLLAYIGETENNHLSDFLTLWNAPKIKDEKIIDINKKTS